MNERVAANLTSIIGGGGDLTNEVNKLHLRKYLVTRGLTPKSQNSVVVALDEDDVKRYFTTSGSGDQPIAVEYECASTFSVPAVDIRAPKYTAGAFVLDSLGFSIAETQADGSTWDGGTNPPDPIITIYRNGVQIYSTQVDDKIADTIEIGRRVTINSDDRLNVVLWDEDFDANDFIGDFGLVGNSIFSSYYIREPVPMRATQNGSQIKNVTLFITPAR